MSDARFASLEREVENLKARVLELERMHAPPLSVATTCFKTKPDTSLFCAREKDHDGRCAWDQP